jgi:hypothetical protein
MRPCLLMKHAIVALALAALVVAPLGCRSQESPTPTGVTQMTSADVGFPLPEGTTMTGTAPVNEIGAFPEEIAHAQGHPDILDTAAGVAATDRMYETTGSYEDTVAFFDHALSTNGYKSSRKTTMRTATMWSVRCPDGRAARVAVRSTSPTGVEVVASNLNYSGDR